MAKIEMEIVLDLQKLVPFLYVEHMHSRNAFEVPKFGRPRGRIHRGVQQKPLTPHSILYI